MDTITHGLAGALIGRAAGEEHVRASVAVTAIAAMLPDADAFFMPGSPPFTLGTTLSYLEYHRGPSHSFVVAPLLALLVAAAAKLFARRIGLAALWGLALAGIVSHILFDWITSYGTMFFSPLSWRRYALDWVFILDPVFTGILVIFLVAAFAFRRRGSRRMAIFGCGLLFLHIGFCAFQHGRALRLASKLVPGLPAGAYAALPQPFSPFRWALFADSGNAVSFEYVDLGPFAKATPRTFSAAPGAPADRGSVWRIARSLPDFYPPPDQARLRTLPTNESDPAVSAARSFPDVSAWYRFARFPVARVERGEDGAARVTLTDLRFRGPWGRTAFEYEVLLSPEGRERASGFVRVFVTEPARRR